MNNSSDQNVKLDWKFESMSIESIKEDEIFEEEFESDMIILKSLIETFGDKPFFIIDSEIMASAEDDEDCEDFDRTIYESHWDRIFDEIEKVGKKVSETDDEEEGFYQAVYTFNLNGTPAVGVVKHDMGGIQELFILDKTQLEDAIIS